MMHRGKWFILAIAVACIGCHRLSGRFFAKSAVDEQDNDIDQIIELQKRVVDAETAVITFVKSDTNRWVQHEFGWWYRYTHLAGEHPVTGDLPMLLDTCCTIHESVYSLDGKLLMDAIRWYNSRATDTGGQSTEPFAYRMMIGYMHPTDTLALLIPWPYAYGKQGSEAVPPFTSIHVTLCLHDAPCQEVTLITDTTQNHI